jgi:hypothetical protein
VRASRAFLWRKKEPKFPFFIVLWISSIDQLKTLVILVLLSFVIYFSYAHSLVCFNLFLVYSFVVSLPNPLLYSCHA